MADLLDAIVVGGGQAGLAAARQLQRSKRSFVVLEAGAAPIGSWKRYYDSLVLFSPARFSSLPELPFPGAPDRYPVRDEVADYLAGYARHFALPIELDTRVDAVMRDADGVFEVRSGARSWRARGVIVATGPYAQPYVPTLPGREQFRGRVLHTIDYRSPAPFSGERVVIVGGGNSALQIGAELAAHARVTLATRRAPRFVPQIVLGKDIHWWFHHTRVDRWLLRISTAVIDDGRYREAVAAGRPDRRGLFGSFSEDGVVWPDGTAEHVDSVIFATGFRAGADFLAPLGALDAEGRVLHKSGCSTTVPGLGFVGLPMQRNFASSTLRGCGPDAEQVVRRLGASR